MKTYTLDQIKKAFFLAFNESGERWFDYLSTPEENLGCTEIEWDDFLEWLEKDNK